MADEIEGTFDKLKAGAKAVAKKVTDPSKDLGDEYDKERGKENSTGYERTTGSGTSDPMSPEKLASNEPTAVRRDIWWAISYVVSKLLWKTTGLNH